MSIEVRYYTDPACVWSWGAEPTLRRLMWEFGDGLGFRWVMGGLARSYGPDYRDTEGSIGSGAGCFEDLMAHWLQVTAETGMPVDARIWSQNPILSTYPACQGVKAAAEQGSGVAYAYLRRLREGVMLERRKLDGVEALVAEAGPAGLDIERFRIDLTSNAITEAFATDLDEVRDVPEGAREADSVKETEGHERVSFPSAVFVGESGSRHGVWGWQPYAAYRQAALAAGARPEVDRPPKPMEAVERFGRATTAEIEALTDRPAPVVRAELWALARDWRLKPVDVLGGTVWEPA